MRFLDTEAEKHIIKAGNSGPRSNRLSAIVTKPPRIAHAVALLMLTNSDSGQ